MSGRTPWWSARRVAKSRRQENFVNTPACFVNTSSLDRATRSRGWVDRLCRQHEGQSSSCRRLSFTVEVCASDPSVWTPNVLRLLWETWLKNGQKLLKVIFLPSLACRDRSQLIDLDRGSGHRSCTCTVNPKNFFLLLLCQPFYISRVSLFFFSCIVALHKHWRMLDHLTVSSVCFGDAPSAARFRSRRSCICWLWTFSQRTFVWF